MRPRRILYVTRIVRGGVEVIVDQLARGLDKSQYEPVVLFDTNIHSNIKEKLTSSGIKTIDSGKCEKEQTVNLPSSRKSFDIAAKVEACLGKQACQVYFSLKSFHEFIRRQAPRIKFYLNAIRKNEIDLVHTHHDLTKSKPEIIAARIAGVPCVAHRHGYPAYTSFDRLFVKYVEAFIYISSDVAKHHFGQGEPESKGIVIHNGIDANEFTQCDTAQVKAELNCKPGDRLVGMIGRIDWWKGQEYFIEAVAEVAKQFPEVKGLIIGGLKNKNIADRMQYYTKLQSLVKALNIEDKIIFTGFRNDVPRLIASLDVVVHASATPEPFGLVVIEGMAAGKPVVATAAGGVLDIIEDGVSGLLVPCKDSKAMARAMVQLLSDRDKAAQMGQAARLRVLEKFTVQQQVRAVERLYSSILGIT
jgi:glycosyltransferase involved in cell wall biosynthesis